MNRTKNCRLENTITIGLMPWELVAKRMSEKLGKPTTAARCMGIARKAERKLRQYETILRLNQEIRQ